MRAIRRDVWYDKGGVFRRDADRRAARRMIAEKAPHYLTTIFPVMP